MSFYFFAIRAAICLASIGLVAYAYIDQKNHLTELSRIIPELEKEVKQVQEENVNLQYEIDRFRSPRHLLKLSKLPQYRHLRFPTVDEVVVIQEND